MKFSLAVLSVLFTVAFAMPAVEEARNVFVERQCLQDRGMLTIRSQMII